MPRNPKGQNSMRTQRTPELTEARKEHIQRKIAAFEYMIHLLKTEYKKDITQYCTLRLMKILFFTVGHSCDEENPGLTTLFNRFEAWPYGPVEVDLYRAIKRGNGEEDSQPAPEDFPPLDSPYIVYRTHVKEVASGQFAESGDMQRALRALHRENPELLDLSTSLHSLIELSHRWDCWIEAYRPDAAYGQCPIDGVDIQFSNKCYR